VDARYHYGTSKSVFLCLIIHQKLLLLALITIIHQFSLLILKRLLENGLEEYATVAMSLTAVLDYAHAPQKMDYLSLSAYDSEWNILKGE
jgi:hypothetical protein